MKKIRVICLLLCLTLVITGITTAVQGTGVVTDQSVVSGCHSTDAVKTMGNNEQILETSKAVLLYELKSDTMVYGWNLDEKIYPSSMVKLMTALVALEKGNLTDKVVVTKRALSNVAIGSVIADLVAGEELTLEALLYCMMAASANDAATVIAEHIGGSQQAFLDMMNAKAAELGCIGTHFSNVHGLHDDQTYTTVRDIGKILDVALENPDFKTLFCAKSYIVPATNKSEEREIFTSNHMMSREKEKRYFDSRVTGGKTGATDAAGRCLAVTAEKNGMEMLAIVMGAKPTYEADGKSLKTYGSFEEMKILLDYAFSGFEYRQVFYENQTVTQYPVTGGANNLAVQPEKALSTILPVGLDIQALNWVYGNMNNSLVAPVEKGQQISTLQLWYGDLCLAQANLVAAHSVNQQTSEALPLPPEPPKENEGSWSQLLTVFGILFGISVVGVLIYFGIRAALAARAKAKRKRMRENRRRSW